MNSLSDQSSYSFLLKPENAAVLDREASESWGLSPFALVEAAGRYCALELEKEIKSNPFFASSFQGRILVCAGSGNNGADALVMLRSLVNKKNAVAVLNKYPSSDENNPRSMAVKALEAMGVPVITFNSEEQTEDLFRDASLIIDGIAGTGLKGRLEGAALEMVKAINKKKNDKEHAECCIVSIDLPSGSGQAWQPDFPVVDADYTLAVEPVKTVLYTPQLRPYCGKIIPVRNIFPRNLLEKYGDGELLSWENTKDRIPCVKAHDYKYKRGVVEIHAGAIGTQGAARIAARGASAAGGGLIRLVLDDALYPIIASSLGGTMAVPASKFFSNKLEAGEKDCILAGPGRGRDTKDILQYALNMEKKGIPLVLDADGIVLLKELFPETSVDSGGHNSYFFHGKTILTPHPGELETLSGIPKNRLLCEPALIAEIAHKLNAVILFKSHVMVIASPCGRVGYIDGMEPSLGAGGSGDFLAGLCAGIAGRMYALEKSGIGNFDPYTIAAAAGTLLLAASRSLGRQFYDPLELAKSAALLAGHAWLPFRQNYSEKPQ